MGTVLWETLGNPISLFFDIQKLFGGCLGLFHHILGAKESRPSEWIVGLKMFETTLVFHLGDEITVWELGWVLLKQQTELDITSIQHGKLTGLYWDVPRDFGPLEYRSQTTKIPSGKLT